MKQMKKIDIFEAIKRHDMKVVIQYIEQQSDLNIKNTSNQTVVQYAASFAGTNLLSRNIYHAIELKLFWDRVNYARSLFAVFYYGFFHGQTDEHFQFLDSCDPKFFRYLHDIWSDYTLLDICRFSDKNKECFTVQYWLKQVFDGSTANMACNAQVAYARIEEISKIAKDARHCIIAHTNRSALHANNPLSPLPNGAKDIMDYYQALEVFVNEISDKIGMLVNFKFMSMSELEKANPGEEVIKLLKLGMEKRNEQFLGELHETV